MIELILTRIAKRSSPQASAKSADTAPELANVDVSTPFSARTPVSPVSPSRSAQKGSWAAWELAKDAHYRSRHLWAQTHEVPSAYSSYSMVHAMIGAVIWSERKNDHKNTMHIVGSNGDVVAVVYPGDHTVAVRQVLNGVGLDVLSIKELAASHTPSAQEIASQFEMTTVHMLLWYYGQAMPESVEEIPRALLDAKIVLRKLPLVPPNALTVSHLQLIHLFSAGPVYLQTLFDLLSPQAKSSLCADLTSLYLTGCLVAHLAVGPSA